MKTIEVGLKSRDHLVLTVGEIQGESVLLNITGLGCSLFLLALMDWRAHVKKPLKTIPMPQGESHSAMLLREALLRAQGMWNPPYKEEELCHCRAVAYKEVDAAIVSGCHTVDEVANQTSAGTACGTCRDDTQKTIEFRKKSA